MLVDGGREGVMRVTKKTTLVAWAVVALLAGLGWVASDGVSGWMAVVVIGLPVVLGMLSIWWGE